MVYTGQGSYAYLMIEGTKGAANPAADVLLPLNPTKDFNSPKPKYAETIERTFDSLEPKIIYSNELTPGEGPINTSFRDPFGMLTFFTNKTVGGTWVTGTGTITADFTSNADADTVGLQYRIKDAVSTNEIDKLLKYGLPQKYSWVVEPGKLLGEILEYKFLNFATNTQAPAINNNFHDQAWGSGVGGWANWDNTGLNGTGKRSVTDMVLHWGAAALTGLSIKTMNLEFSVPSDSEQLYSSLAHSVDYKAIRDFKLTLGGLVADLTLITEYEKLFSDKTKQTLQLYYDHTTNYEKYLQFTNAYISGDSDVVTIPEAGKPAEVSVVIMGGEATAASFSGKYKDRPDPSALITAA